MARYQQLDEFMRRVRLANPTFERWVRSSLRPLINVLEADNGTAIQVRNALQALAADKANKYKDALYYLQGNYPALAANSIRFGALAQTNAARYAQVALPNGYNPARLPQADRVVSGNIAFTGLTVEQVLLSAAGNKGIILIHLSGWQAPMGDIYNGHRVVDHMNSVLRVGRENNVALCILHMEGAPVCPQLATEVGLFAHQVVVLQSPEHMGTVDANFLNFAQTHDPVVVMGFDACICVRANMFGAPDKLRGTNNYAAPLVTLADLVTSRAVLVTTGTVCPVNHRGEYGVLFNT